MLAFLRTRVGLLDGVVFSGGEPTLQDALPAAIEDVRQLGFRVGLHTAGQYPDTLVRVLDRIDWVGFDVKAPWEAYRRVTGVDGSGDAARESLAYLVRSGVDFEVRTTVHPDLLSAEDLTVLADQLVACGVRRYAVQGFRPQGCVGNLRPASLHAANLPAGLADRFAWFEVRGS